MTCPDCGEAARCVGLRDKQVVSLLGTLKLNRHYYHCQRCGQGCCPWEELLRIADQRLTPAAREVVCLTGIQQSFGQVANRTLHKLTGLRLWSSAAGRRTDRSMTSWTATKTCRLSSGIWRRSARNWRRWRTSRMNPDRLGERRDPVGRADRTIPLTLCAGDEGAAGPAVAPPSRRCTTCGAGERRPLSDQRVQPGLPSQQRRYPPTGKRKQPPSDRQRHDRTEISQRS